MDEHASSDIVSLLIGTTYTNVLEKHLILCKCLEMETFSHTLIGTNISPTARSFRLVWLLEEPWSRLNDLHPTFLFFCELQEYIVHDCKFFGLGNVLVAMDIHWNQGTEALGYLLSRETKYHEGLCTFWTRTLGFGQERYVATNEMYTSDWLHGQKLLFTSASLNL